MNRNVMNRLALIGASGHASDVLGLVEALQRAGHPHEVIGMFHSDPDAMDPRRFEGRGVAMRRLDELTDEDRDGLGYLACVGYPPDRRAVTELDVVRGLASPTLVHPTAELGTGVRLGDGVVVLAQVSVSPLAVIGDHAYVSHGALVGHDTVIGEFASLMPGCSVSGDCVIGADVMIGSNATVLEKVKVGTGAVVGAGAVVTRDVAPGTTVVGSPAKPLNR